MGFEAAGQTEGVVGRPVNQRVVFLESLSQAVRHRFPEVRATVVLARAGTASLRVAWGSRVEEIGCDLTEDGWYFTWGFDPDSSIGPVGDATGVARVVGTVLGVR